MKDKIQKLDKRIQMLTKALNDLQSNYEEKVVELSVIRKTADLFTYEFDLKEACQKTLDILYEELHPQNSSIHIRNPDSNIFEPFTVKGKQIAGHKKNVITNKIIGTRFRPGMGTAGWAAQNKKIVHIPDVSKDTRFFAGIETKIDIGSLICVPLLNQDNVEGILNLSHSAKHAFPKRSLNLLNILMKSIGAGIGNIRLFNEYTDAYSALLKTNQELQNTLNDLHETRLVILNSEKLSGTRILAAGIAHEFNNILAGIYGYSELSLLNKSPYEIDSNIKNILKLSDRGTEIVKNLLAFAGKSKISKKMIIINTIIKRLIKIILPEFNNLGITLDENYGKLTPMKCDTNQMSQVFVQLMVNAKDSMADNNGGILKITTSQSKKFVEVVIEDNGRGIEPDILENIFEPFVTTKGAFGGGIPERHGLGLSLAYGIIKEHGGDIKIESQLSKGCRVTVSLPVDPPKK